MFSPKRCLRYYDVFRRMLYVVKQYKQKVTSLPELRYNLTFKDNVVCVSAHYISPRTFFIAFYNSKFDVWRLEEASNALGRFAIKTSVFRTFSEMKKPVSKSTSSYVSAASRVCSCLELAPPPPQGDYTWHFLSVNIASGKISNLMKWFMTGCSCSCLNRVRITRYTFISCYLTDLTGFSGGWVRRHVVDMRHTRNVYKMFGKSKENRSSGRR